MSMSTLDRRSDEEKVAAVMVEIVKRATAPLLARIAELEAKAQTARDVSEAGFGAALARFEALETRAAIPGPAGPKGDPGRDGKDGVDGKGGIPGERGADGKDGLQGEKGLDGHDGKDGRDGQPGVPGVPGRDGERGEKGLDGAPGRDGTLEGLKVVQPDERTLRFVRADGYVLGEARLLVPLDHGVYQETQAYEKGDCVTFGGSLFLAQRVVLPGERPEESGGAWRLAVKRGRDGKEGKAGPKGERGEKGEKGADGRIYR